MNAIRHIVQASMLIMLLSTTVAAFEEQDIHISRVAIENGRVLVETAGQLFVSPEDMDMIEVNALKSHVLRLKEKNALVHVRYREINQGGTLLKVLVDLTTQEYGRYLIDEESVAMEGVDNGQQEQVQNDGALQDMLPGAIVSRESGILSVSHDGEMLVLGTDDGEVRVEAQGDEQLMISVEEAATLAMLQGDVLTLEMVVSSDVSGNLYARLLRMTGPDGLDLTFPSEN